MREEHRGRESGRTLGVFARPRSARRPRRVEVQQDVRRVAFAGVVEVGAPRQVYVDARLRGIAWRKQRLVVDSEHVSWGGKSVLFDQVTALAYWATGTALARGCEIELCAGMKRTHIAFRARDEVKYDVFKRTIAALQTHVERRLVGELLAAVAAGEQVEAASLRLSRAGLGVGRSQVPWAAIVAVQPPAWRNPKVLTGDLLVYARGERGDVKPFAHIFFSQPNGVLLPALIQACAAQYSAGL